MKNIVIFEGIASSGKTTLEALLAEKLQDCVVVSEGETLMPIVENTESEIAVAYLQKQLEKIREKTAKNIIIDRFHFTHAFRTQSHIEVFLMIENNLQKIGNILVVLLTVAPDSIKERIEETILRRKDGWKKGAQGTIDEKVAYYTNQQDVLKGIAGSSRLPITIIDTTTKNWDTCLEVILSQTAIWKNI